MFNPIFNEKVLGRKHSGRCAFAEPDYLVTERLNAKFKMNRTAMKNHEIEPFQGIDERNIL